MRVLVTGASGLIGTALTRSLASDGHEVRTLVRREPRTAGEFRWDPAAHTIDTTALDGVDAVVNLAGVPVAGGRWSDQHKQAVLDSRVDATTTLCEAIAALPASDRPAVLANASAVGYYGDRGDTVLEEDASNGEGFLALVVRAWEGATRAAADAGVRVAYLRTGLVLSASGGLLGQVLPVFRLGLGGRLGSGKQWMPLISLDDEVAAIRFVLEHDDLDGPVNLGGPHPVTNAEFTSALGAAVHRPALFVVPRFALRIPFGDFADEGALVSQRMVPARLTAAGFAFQHPTVEDQLAAAGI